MKMSKKFIVIENAVIDSNKVIKNKEAKESYDFDVVDAKEEKIIDELGTENALLDISKALDVDTKRDIYEYIGRINDIDFSDDSDADDMEEKLKDELGDEELLDSLCRALDYDTKEDIYDYIIRMNDLDYNDELDESTSGIGCGSYTTKAIDMLPKN